MNPTELSIRHIFGINSNVCGNISFNDDENILYVAGHNIVIYNKVDKRQRVLQLNELTDMITAFSSGCGKRHAVVAERGERPHIHIYDLRTMRRKKSIPSECASKELICLHLSEDENILLTLSGSPTWTLTSWNWSKGEPIASIQAPVGCQYLKCSLSPLDSSVVCAIGKDRVDFYRVVESEMRLLRGNNITGHNFVSLCWLRAPASYLVAGTDAGELLVFHSGDLAFRIPVVAADDSKSQLPITSIAALSQGLLCGLGEGEGVDGQTSFMIIPTTGDNSVDGASIQTISAKYFQSPFQIKTELSGGGVTAMAINVSDTLVAAVTTDGQILEISWDISSDSLAKLSSESIKYAVSPFHSAKAITGLDTCIRKPLIVSCARDNTVRFWNIKTHEMELMKSFPEEIHSVALHPTGLEVAIGFSDKLRIYHVLAEDLRLCLEVPIKLCRDCRFNKGGSLLAAAFGQSILVLDFYTGEKIADLKGHNGKVRSVQWLDSSFHLLSCGQDGAVYIWDLAENKRRSEFVQKGIVYSSLVATTDSAIVVGSDRAVRELLLPDLSSHKFIDAGVVFTQACMSTRNKLLIVGSSEYGKPGHLRAFSYPLIGEYDDYPCMGAPITRARITPEEKFLVVGDDNGCVILFELRDRVDALVMSKKIADAATGGVVALPDLSVVDSWSDEVFVTRAELEERENAVAELRSKIEELQLHNEYQLRLREMGYTEKMKEMSDRHLQKLEAAKHQMELLRGEYSDCEVENLEKLRQLAEKHEHDVQHMETNFQAQIMALVDEYQELAKNRDVQIARLEEQRRQLVTAHETYVEELLRDFQLKLEEDRSTKQVLLDDKDQIERELKEFNFQVEDDLDNEIEDLRRQYEDKLNSCRESTLKYKGENGMMGKKFVITLREIDEQKDTIKDLQSKERELLEQIKLLEKEVSAHKKEIKLKDLSIGEKEKRIYELKKKNQELDKFKFVLDFKIRELKQQIEPRQLEILGMRDQIKNMDEELEKYHKSNSRLDEMIGSLRTRTETLQTEVRSKRVHAGVLESSIESFRSAMQLLITHILSPDRLKQAVIDLVATHGATGSLPPALDTEVEDEYNRHREYLHRSVKKLQDSLESKSSLHGEKNRRMRQGNLEMMAEIQKQKELNRQLNAELQARIGRARLLARSRTPSTQERGALGVGIENMDFGSISVASGAGNKDLGEDTLEILALRMRRIAFLRAAVADLEAKTVSSDQPDRDVLPPVPGAEKAPPMPAPVTVITTSVAINDGIALNYDASGRKELYVDDDGLGDPHMLTLPPLV